MNTEHIHFDTRQLNAIPITEVARRLGCTLKRAGTVYKTHCPWHEDRHPSLTFYERPNENRCHCFSCGQGGSVIDFVMQCEQWSFHEACQWLSQEFGIANMPLTSHILHPKPRHIEAPPPPDFTYIPTEMLDELASEENSLCRCLMQMYNPEFVKWVTEEYRIGTYSMNEMDDYTVFPNIDRHGRVCNLKVQHYETDPSSPRFAHSDPGSCYWLGAMWVREGRLPANAVFNSTCLFGEHLLPQYPDKAVALVESPKNALFGTLEEPELTWVATGNKQALKRDVLKALRGRDVIVFPDCDAVDQWTDSLKKMADIANFTVSDFCRCVAPEGQEKYDIADYLQQLHMTSH